MENKHRLQNEKETVSAMIRLYCHGNQHVAKGLPYCPFCADLLNYAHERLDKCVYGESKPVCAQCPIHCYRPSYRETITAVMRYSGPKMALRHPLLSLRHIFASKKPAPDFIPRRRGK